MTQNIKSSHKEIVSEFRESQGKLVLQASDLSLETIAQMVERKSIDITPKYQRRERWDSNRQSLLIESFLLNIPVPPIYLSEEDYGVYSVIDGKQRITAIYRFMRDELALVEVDTFKSIRDLRFSELPPDLQNALRVRPFFRVVTLLRQTHSSLKYEVFTRLNKGGEPLNAQEIRNVVFRGDLNDAIYELSKNSFLKQQLKIHSEKSAAYQKMVDAEFVLRYMTLTESWNQFSGDYRKSMDQFMRYHQHAPSPKIDELSSQFNRSITACNSIWGKNSFKRPAGSEGWRDQTLAGMYDAQMIGVHIVNDKVVNRAIQNRKGVLQQTRKAFEDKKFEESVRQATNTPDRIVYRIEKIQDILLNA